MADVQKTVLTKFQADTGQYTTPVDKATKSLEKLNKKQKEVQDDSKKTGKVFQSSIGEISESIGKVLPGLGGVAQGFEQAEKAANIFGKGTKAAIAGTGIGILLIGVSELISKFQELGDKAPEDLSFVESKLVALGNWFTDLLPKGTSFVNMILYGINPALGAMADQHDKARDARKKDNEEWDKAIKRLKEVAKQQEDFEKRVLEAEKRRQEGIKRQQEEQKKITDAETKRLADIAAYNEQLELEAINKNILGEINRIQAEEAGARAIEEEARKKMEAESDKAFTDEFIANQKRMADAEKARLDEIIAKEEAKRIIIDAGIDLMQAALIAQFAASKNEKKNAIATSIINTLAGIARIWNTPGNYWVKLAQSIALGALGAANTAKISKQEFAPPPRFEDGGQVPKDGGMIRGRRHIHGGVKFRVGGITNEAEGGEFIVNRKATSRYLPQLTAINNTGLYADGGMVQSEINRTQAEIRNSIAQTRTVLVLEDFKRASERLEVVENLSKI